MSGQHAVLAPSSAARWYQCSGSVKLEVLYPQEETDKSREGTLAHAVCAALLQGSTAPAGATDEMLEGADLYVDEIRKYVDNGMPLLIESRIDCSYVDPNCWGTPDAWAVDRAAGTLYVWDYKFGRRHVEVFENWQLIAYAAGILEVAGLSNGANIHTVRMAVVQPRSYHPDGPVRSWQVSVADLQGYFVKLSMRAKSAMRSDAPTSVGSECRDCSARHACPALQSSAYSAMERAGENVPFDMPPEALGRELTVMSAAAAVLNARISGLENEILGNIKRGVAVRGWATEQGTGREKWSRPIEEILALGEMMGIAVSKPGAITPKQAVKAGLPAAVVAGYTETPKGEIKLVSDNGSFTRKIFQGASK